MAFLIILIFFITAVRHLEFLKVHISRCWWGSKWDECPPVKFRCDS